MSLPAIGYFRTSSATNCGADKDSLPRQQQAVRAYAAANDIEIVHEAYDAAVKGSDHVTARPGFNQLMAYAREHGVRLVLVESASRFARDVVVAITGHEYLKQQGVELVAVDAPSHFVEDGPTARMVRTILSAVAAFEKDSLVAKLRGARDRRSAALGRRVEGVPVPDDHRARARALRGQGLSLRGVAAALAQAGCLSRSGGTYSATSVAGMVGERRR